jgi:hypothetical protein
MNTKISLDIMFFNDLQITFPDITTTIAYFHLKRKSVEKGKSPTELVLHQ